MIQEYLLLDNADKDKVEAYKPKGIKKKIFSFNAGNCTYVQFEIEGDNDLNAKKLSAVDMVIREKVQTICLTDDCSVYFCKKLYPLFSLFEHLLRKILYMYSKINHDENTEKRIVDLESKDFGTIFSMLFVDESFMNKVKQSIKERNKEIFTKKEVIQFLESCVEEVFWDKYLGEETVPTLRKNQDMVRLYRNDVMHSHNISWEKYQTIVELMETINDELYKAIQNIETIEQKVNPSFNIDIDNYLNSITVSYDDLKIALQKVYEELSGKEDILANAYKKNFEEILAKEKETIKRMKDDEYLKNAKVVILYGDGSKSEKAEQAEENINEIYARMEEQAYKNATKPEDIKMNEEVDGSIKDTTKRKKQSIKRNEIKRKGKRNNSIDDQEINRDE